MPLTTPRKGLLALFAALLVFSTACVKSDLGVTVKDDGSGTIQLIAAVDVKAFNDAMKQFGDMLGGSSSGNATPTSPTDVFDPKEVDMSKLPPGSKVDAYKEGNFEGLKVTMPFAKPEDIMPTLGKLNESLADSGSLNLGSGPSSPRPTPRPGTTVTPARPPTPARSSSSSNSPADLFEKFTLVKTSDGWKFDATTKPVSSDVGGDPMTAALMGAILKDASASFSLQMPGKITQDNADSKKDGVMKWNLPIASAQAKTLSATTVGSGLSGGGDDGGFPILIVLGAIAVVAVIGGLYYMSKQRQASPPAPPSDPPPPVPGTSL
jgi:hypothetical protein